jgi:hypothetical protein
VIKGSDEDGKPLAKSATGHKIGSHPWLISAENMVEACNIIQLRIL